jgi:glycosyltransferase involved in cell wall biosynthesis
VVTGGPRLPDGIRHPLLRYPGQVPYVAPWLRVADICLAPVFSGSGTRLEVLEYLAAGKPVVATAKAVEGLTVENGRELALSEKPDFADAVCRLAQDVLGSKNMAERGRRLVEASYSWERTAEIWRNGLAPFLSR